MADINEARQQMMEELQRKIQTDSKLSSIRNKIQNGDYSEASQYGVRSGEILSEVIRGNITEELFQQCDVKGLGDMLLPVIKQENQYVANAVSAAQKAQNAEVGIGIKPLQAENDLSAYFNIFGKMKSDAYDSFEQASWLLDEPIVHDSLSIVDDTLQENAEFQYKSGLRTCVIRDPEPDCCDWCAERAGTFYYPDVPDSVWERHNHCLCEIRIETEKNESEYKQSIHKERADRVAKSVEFAFTRRKVGERGEVIDKPTYNKLTRDFLRRGGLIYQDKNAEENLDKMGAGAAYLPSFNTILFRADPTISEVLEETFHAQQDRRGAFSNYPNDEILLRREIQAQEYLLSMTNKYKIPLEEQLKTEENLKHYRDTLEELLRWKNGIQD